MKILVVGDEKLIQDVISEYLKANQYDVFLASNGEDALSMILKQDFDLLILDIMMPQMDGFTLLKEIPKEKRIPTIVLSARGEEVDKLSGFSLGIDDYVTKPFSPKELIARVKAVLARCQSSIGDIYTYQGLEVHFLSRSIFIDQKEISVTPKEFDLLSYLIKNKGIALSREQLLSHVWGYDFFGEDRTVDTHIKMLRNSLGSYRKCIVTVHGIGYKYVEEK